MHSAFFCAAFKWHAEVLNASFAFFVLFFFSFLACLLPNEALRIKCLKDCRHFTWVVWLFKDMPQYTASWNAAQPTVRCVKSILRQRKKKRYNPALLCKWNKRLVNYGLLLLHQVTKIKHQTNDCKTSLWFAKNSWSCLFFWLLSACLAFLLSLLQQMQFLLIWFSVWLLGAAADWAIGPQRAGSLLWTSGPHKSPLMHVW